MGFIYKITSPSKKLYVGQTRRKVPEKRWKQHCWESRSGKTHALSNAIRKYGAENMKFEVIESCRDDMLNEREHYWIEKLKSSSRRIQPTTGGIVRNMKNQGPDKCYKTTKSIDNKGYIGLYARITAVLLLHKARVARVWQRHLSTFSTLEEAETTLREYTRSRKLCAQAHISVERGVSPRIRTNGLREYSK